MSDALPLSIVNNRRMDKWLGFQPDRITLYDQKVI